MNLEAKKMPRAKRVTRRPTLADIAKEVGVSSATVSLALNGSPLVADETVRRVKEVARKLNYRPHAIARRLSTGRSETVSLFVLGGGVYGNGLFYPSSWIFYSLIFKGISITLAQHKYYLQFQILNLADGDGYDKIARQVMERATDGVLLLLQDECKFCSVRELATLEIPVVTINRKLSPNLGSVQIDNKQGAIDAVDYLLRLGHTRIAHISGPANSYNAQDRQAGYLEAMQQAGLQVPDGYLVQGDWQMESGYDLLQQLMALPVPPTAVFCSNDHMAIGAREALSEMGVSVPDEVSLMGFDDSEVSRIGVPRLTTVKQPLENLGAIAAREILAWKMDKPNGVRHTVILPSLVERDSCARVPI